MRMPTYDLFLVLEPFRGCFQHFSDALGELDKLAARSWGVEVYYQAGTDIALLAIKLDERSLSLGDLALVHKVAAQAGVAVLDPRNLPRDDRARYYSEYLPTYPLRVSYSSVADALAGMAADLGLATPPRATLVCPQPVIDPPPLPNKLKNRRLGSTPPGVPVVPSRRARGKLAAKHRSPGERESYSIVEQAAIARVDASQRAPTVPLILDGEACADPPQRARGKRRKTVRHPTMPETPIALAKTPTPPPIPPKRRRIRKVADGSGPNPVIGPSATVTPALEVRYLRGREWTPARLRSLSLKGAELVAGALPRVGDSIRIALHFAGQHAAIAGIVRCITTVDDASATGSSGFTLGFLQVDSAERRQLVKLLKHARAAGATIKPPPSRVEARLPLNWPIRIGAPGGGFTADAIDLSSRGMFVATARQLETTELTFRFPLDNGEPSVYGRVRVARHLDSATALERGLSTGYGFTIIELGEHERDRFSGFVSRLRLRNDRRVMVGAAAPRLNEIGSALHSVGYTVLGDSDPRMLVELIHRQAPPDVVVIDSTFAARGSGRNQLARLLANRHVPYVASSGEPTLQTRVIVDRLLQVVT